MGTNAQDESIRRPKRGHGEGTITQRPDGAWRGRIMVGSKADGTPDRRSVTGKTRQEVQRKLRELQRQAEQGMLTDSAKRETLAAYLERWLDGVKPTVRPTTHERYGDLLRLHVVPYLGRKRLDALRPDDVQRLYATLLTKVVDLGQGRKAGEGAALSPRTVHHVHTVLHGALEQAVKWGYLPRNVCDVVDPPKVHPREMHAPDADALARLLDSERDSPYLPLWTLAVYTGARNGELLGLQWADLDLDRATVTIRRTLLQTTRGGIPDYAAPKSGKSRAIALPEDAVDALRAHRQRQLAERLALGPDYTDNSLVFATALGTPLGYRNVSRAYKAALGRAGLPLTIRFHDLRHGTATNMRAAGVDLKTVSERLGHSNIGITGDLYTHGVPQADREAAKKLQAMIRGGRARNG